MATTNPTNHDLLDDCNKAIEAVLKVGEATTVFGARKVTRADLKDLIKMRKFLQAEIRRNSGGSDFVKPDWS